MYEISKYFALMAGLLVLNGCAIRSRAFDSSNLSVLISRLSLGQSEADVTRILGDPNDRKIDGDKLVLGYSSYNAGVVLVLNFKKNRLAGWYGNDGSKNYVKGS